MIGSVCNGRLLAIVISYLYPLLAVYARKPGNTTQHAHTHTQHTQQTHTQTHTHTHTVCHTHTK
jgi:carbohydrate-binding DOMON domain-containing protein